MSTSKSGFSSLLPSLKARRIRRAHLRKYSWLPDVLRLKGSIVGQIIGPVLTVTLFAAAVVYAWSIGKSVKLTNGVLPLLSVVVGLILVFRNTTSYDRYWEGRKSFASMTSHVRNLSRLIWVNVSLPPTDAPPPMTKGKTPTTDITAAQLRRRKIECLKLCLSFAFATKHYLRGEDGVHWDDYTDVLPHSLAKFGDGTLTPKTPASASYAATGNNPRSDSLDDHERFGPVSADATKRVRVKRSKTNISGATTPLLRDGHRTVDFDNAFPSVSIPFPLVLAHEINRALFYFRRDGFLETVGPAGVNAMSVIVQGLVDTMTAMERVANTPIPSSYSIHLKQCVTLYLFALPFTLVEELGWGTIPIVTVVAFTFMGIEGIADEIEMPFGLDASDLPLDRYCQDLKEEVHYIMARLPEGGEGGYGYDDGEGDD